MCQELLLDTGDTQVTKINRSLSPWCILSRWSEGVQTVQMLSCVLLFTTPWTTACQASLSIASSRSLLRLMSSESMMPSHHLTFHRGKKMGFGAGRPALALPLTV